MTTMIWVCANNGYMVAEAINGYDRCICFEPEPEAFAGLAYRFSDDKRVTVVNAACGAAAGHAMLNVYNKGGVSSSLGTMTDAHRLAWPYSDLSLRGTADVDVVNLCDWCGENGVDAIDRLYMDAQGLDLTIVGTIRPLLEARKVRYVQCEAFADWARLYDGVPDNSVSGFRSFFADLPYEEVAWAILGNGAAFDVSWEVT